CNSCLVSFLSLRGLTPPSSPVVVFINLVIIIPARILRTLRLGPCNACRFHCPASTCLRRISPLLPELPLRGSNIYVAWARRAPRHLGSSAFAESNVMNSRRQWRLDAAVFVLFVLGLLVGLCVFGYDPADLRDEDGPCANLLGLPGAIVAQQLFA